MSRQAWRYDALERNTKQIQEFCQKFKFDLKQLTPYQFRIEDMIDVYPVRQKWHWLSTDERGTWVNTDNLKAVILARLPEIEDEGEPEKDIDSASDVFVSNGFMIDGEMYELASYGPPFNDGSRQASLRRVK